jgi:hypothetical protein
MVHISSDTGGELPSSVLTHIGKFTEYVVWLGKNTPLDMYSAIRTLHTFVEAQQNSSKLKSFFGQGEMGTLLKDCKAGLQQGLEIFQVWHLFGDSTTH